jgi:DNA processing protein
VTGAELGRVVRAGDRERQARAAWSRIAEPGDAAAHALVAEVGAVEALERVRGPLAEGHWGQRLRRLPGHLLAEPGSSSVRVVVPGDAEWPGSLHDLGPGTPFCLWVRGESELAALSARSVAIVGARASTGYGEYVAGELGIGSTAAGFTVVSGAAYGIDGAAHRGALTSPGPTIAVLACGVDRAYPRGHESLLGRILGSGLLVSEVPPGSAPTRWRFLQRNRLIAALTRATVVVEAARRSGALGTARRAIELGREVGAVPGPVTSSTSTGCHDLLRAGATCVTTSEDVLELLRPIGEQLRLDDGQVLDGRPRAGELPSAIHDGLAPELMRLLDAVPLRSWATTDSIALVAGVDGSKALSGLGRLESRGLTRRSAHGWRRAVGGR